MAMIEGALALDLYGLLKTGIGEAYLGVCRHRECSQAVIRVGSA